MVELMALFTLLVVGALLVGVCALAWTVLKVVFKVALLPVWIVLGLVKVLLGVAAAVILALVLGPIALVVIAVLAVPVLIVGAIIWAGVALVT